MNKILVYEPDLRLNDLYQGGVDSYVNNFEVITFYDKASILDYLAAESKDVLLCLVDYISDEGCGIELIENMEQMGFSIPSILLCSSEPHSQQVDQLKEFHSDSAVFYKNKSSKELTNTIRSILSKLDRVNKSSFSEFTYTPVSPMILLYSDSVPADVYLKNDEEKDSVVFSTDTKVSPEAIHQFTVEGVTKFYIISSIRDEFYDYFLNVLGEKEYTNNRKLEGGNLAIQQQVLGMTFDRIKELGADEKMISVAKRNIEANLETINSSKTLKKLLSKIVGKGNIEFEHSMTTGFLSQMIIKQIDLRSADPPYKLSLAAFFHDLFSPDFDDTIIKLESMGELDGSTLKSSNPSFYNHAAKAAEFVSQLNDVPSDTAQIIATHHELPKGKGFPRQLFGSRTSFLGCTFNTSRYFCLQLYKYGWNKSGVDKALDEMGKSFNDGNYKKSFEALCILFRQNKMSYFVDQYSQRARQRSQRIAF